jgi:hypothetical protein
VCITSKLTVSTAPFVEAFLGDRTRLNAVRVDWQSEDTSYLDKDAYDAGLSRQSASAVCARAGEALGAKPAPPRPRRQNDADADADYSADIDVDTDMDMDAAFFRERPVCVGYDPPGSPLPSDRFLVTFEAVAGKLGLLADAADRETAVQRGGYRGVVQVRGREGRLVLVAPFDDCAGCAAAAVADTGAATDAVVAAAAAAANLGQG